jgi:hypothetical protein
MSQPKNTRRTPKIQKPKEVQENPPSNSWRSYLGIVSLIVTLLAAVFAIINGAFDVQKDIKEITATLTPVSTITATNTPIASATPLFTPGPFNFIELPTQIQMGNDVKVVVQAWQGAACFLEYYTADGNLSMADGLGITSPDSYARCAWVWKINANTHAGTGKLVIHLGEFEETHFLEVLPSN